jgi:cytoskeletal protein CcmA (bactofilin family)
MERQPISLKDWGLRSSNQPQPPPEPAPGPAAVRNMLLSIGGAGARIEGVFHIADSIDIECEVSGEMVVGGRLVIGENAVVSADVQTVDALIMGRYSGNLRASGSIEITAAGRVSGNLETNELIVAKGAIFTGQVTRPGDLPRQQSPPSDNQVHAQPEPPGPESVRQPEAGRTGNTPPVSTELREAIQLDREESNDTEETPAGPLSSKLRPWS